MAAPHIIPSQIEPAYNSKATSSGFPGKGGVANDVAGILVEQIRAMVRKEMEEENAAKDKRIAELEQELRKAQELKIIPLHNEAPPERHYEYDYAFFPKDNADTIIDGVIELAESKREGDKYLLTRKTDWYIVAKVLHYYGVFSGDEYDFLTNILPNVVKSMKDRTRAERLSAEKSNFATKEPDSYMKNVPVHFWDKNAKKEKEENYERRKQGEKIPNAITEINRCYNIKRKLGEIFIKNGVVLVNY